LHKKKGATGFEPAT